MVKNKIFYQLALRSFTDEGTLQAATAHLDELKTLGIDIVYLTACFKADGESDRATWSKRQIASGCDNPYNPYKMADYFTVDEEYGTDADLKAFVDRAHELGLKVLFDLVYLHCGRNAVFLKEHPDYVIQNEDGTPKIAELWPFARLNYENRGLREYLFENGEYFVRDFHVDGFRCDVGDGVPLDFWKEFAQRVRALNKNLIMLNEGANPKSLDVFDYDYNGIGNTFTGEFTIDYAFSDDNEKFEKFRAYLTDTSEVARSHVNFVENHDIATDYERFEKRYAGKAELVLFMLYVSPGVPYLWNGNEYADDSENSMFSNRFYGKRSAFNRALAETEKGKARFAFVKKLNELYHAHSAFYDGERKSEKYGDVLVLICKDERETLRVVMNFGKSTATVTDLDGSILLSHDAEMKDNAVTLEPFGFALLS